MSGPNGTAPLTDARIYLAQYDISGDLNQIAVSVTNDALPDETFGQVAHTKKPGLPTIKANISGFSKFNATALNAIDGRIEGNLSVVDIPLTFAKTGNIGENSFFFKSMLANFVRDGSIGQLLKFKCDAEATGTNVNLVRATIMEDGKTSRVAAGNSATQTLGAVLSTQKVYAALHVTAFVGTDITFTIKHATTDFATITGMTAFAQVTAPTSEYWLPVAGPITDTFFRVYWTTSGGFTSFSAIVSIGIQ